MRLTTLVLTVCVLGVALAGQTTTGSSPDVLLKAALQKEQIDKDLPAALAQYKAIVERFPKDAVAARALLQMAGIHKTQGQPELAREAYRRILSDFPASGEPADRARLELAAAPTPPALSDRLVSIPDAREAGVGAVSHDGRRLSVSLGDGLAVLDMTTMAMRVVVAQGSLGPADLLGLGWAVWSPDDTELMFIRRFVHDREMQSEIRLVRTSGGPARLLKAIPSEARLHAWSPDGRFALASQYEWTPSDLLFEHLILVSTADGSHQTLKTLGPFHNGLLSGIGRAAFSPDGRFVAYDFLQEESKRRVISIISADRRVEAALPSGSAADQTLLDWLPDGHVVFKRDGNLWTIQPDTGRGGSEAELVARDVGSVQSLGFTRDGRLFVRRKIGGFDVYLASVDPVSGKMVDAPRLLNRPEPEVNREAVSWSPTGDRLAYWRSGRTLVIHNPATGAQRTYAMPLFGMSYPAWQPDGKALVFRSADADNRVGLYKVNLDSEGVEFLGPGFRVLFSPDGRDMILRDRIRRDLATGEESRLTYQAAGFPVARSRDGRFVALYANAERSITIVPIDGGPLRATIRNVEGLSNLAAFSPDGRFLYFVADAGVMRAPVEGGPAQPTGIYLRNIYDFSLHPDGRQIALSSRWQPMEIRVWENLVPKGRRDPARLLKVRVLYTIAGGRVVYQR